MVSMVVPVSDKLQAEVKHFSWVSWSEVAKEELLKREIFERYIKTGSISDEEWEFCERIDWHPVDELPLKESFIKELKIARSEPSRKAMSLEEFNTWCEKI